MAFCSKCGAQLVQGAGFCGQCGAPFAAAAAAPGGGAKAPAAGGAAPAAQPASGAAPATRGLTSNVAAMLAYFTIIPAIIFLVVEPFNKDRFVRFHSFQSIFFNIAWIVFWFGMFIVDRFLWAVPILGWLISIGIYLLVDLGGFILWLILVLKAYKNEKFMLPVIGAMAEQQAGK